MNKNFVFILVFDSSNYKCIITNPWECAVEAKKQGYGIPFVRSGSPYGCYGVSDGNDKVSIFRTGGTVKAMADLERTYRENQNNKYLKKDCLRAGEVNYFSSHRLIITKKLICQLVFSFVSHIAIFVL